MQSTGTVWMVEFYAPYTGCGIWSPSYFFADTLQGIQEWYRTATFEELKGLWSFECDTPASKLTLSQKRAFVYDIPGMQATNEQLVSAFDRLG